jgi:hypothetical protein
METWAWDVAAADKESPIATVASTKYRSMRICFTWLLEANKRKKVA